MSFLLNRFRQNRLIVMAAVLVSIQLATSPAMALSEIQREELPPTEGAEPVNPSMPATPAPQAPASTTPETPEQAAPQGDDQSIQPQDGDAAQGNGDEQDGPLPEVLYDVSKLPEPVQRMRQLLIDAAKTGDIEKLRPLIGMGDSATQLSLTDITSDPIEFLKGQSDDPEGEELLAILEEVLSAGYVHLDEGTPEELYVWPYFFAYPLDKLTPPQKVEMYKIITAGDYYEMVNFGNYIFYRVGISPEGRFAFFVAGE